MVAEPTQQLKLFYCYAHEDKALRDALDSHLSSLKRSQQIITWSDREISPGADWQRAIDQNLDTVHIILLLVSAHFMASDYCYGIEMKRALERHKAGEARVIPILLRPVDWEDAPFSELQVLPSGARPITRWRDRDEAFRNITQGIRIAIKELVTLLKMKEEKKVSDKRPNDKTLLSIDQTIQSDFDNATSYIEKGISLYDLQRYDEALLTYDQAIQLDPNDPISHNNKGYALYRLQSYDNALVMLNHAIHLDPSFTLTYGNKGAVLFDLQSYDEALATYDQAIRFDPDDASSYYNRGVVLDYLQRIDEALAALDQAIHLDPDDASFYYYRGIVLQKLKKFGESQRSFKKAKLLGYPIQI